jgi:hypothetical protein
MDTMIAGAALAVSICSLIISVYFWSRSFRPIVSSAVKMHTAVNVMIAYDLTRLRLRPTRRGCVFVGGRLFRRSEAEPC